jgi:hypothetical protein
VSLGCPHVTRTPPDAAASAGRPARTIAHTVPSGCRAAKRQAMLPSPPLPPAPKADRSPAGGPAGATRSTR